MRCGRSRQQQHSAALLACPTCLLLLPLMQVLQHAGRTMQQFGVRTTPARGALDSQRHKSQNAAYNSSNLK